MRITKILFLAITLVFTTMAFGSDKPSVGVAEFTNETSASWWYSDAGRDLAGMLTNELASTGKFKQRATGAFVGVPLGFLVGVALPQSRIGYALAVVAATLTLISFSSYIVGFGLRCFFIALAASFAGGASPGSGAGVLPTAITSTFCSRRCSPSRDCV